MTILDELIKGAHEDMVYRRNLLEEARLREQALATATPTGLLAALRGPTRPHFIAEIKRASPSAGDLNLNLDAGAMAQVYAQAGATAVSVLTEERRFKGSLKDLELVAATSGIPTLRKDFITDTYQIWEARKYGASAVLLSVAALTATTLVQLSEEARTAELDVLVEVHDSDELEIAVGCGANLVGINARNLKTFEVDLSVCERLAADVPRNVLLVAESGIDTRDDVKRLQAAGFAAFLVGSSLVTSADPAAKLAELRGDAG